jgi:hypothetical protein
VLLVNTTYHTQLYISEAFQWDCRKDGSSSQTVKNIVTVSSIIRVIDAPATFTHTVVDIYVIGSTANVADLPVFSKGVYLPACTSPPHNA